MNQGSMTQKTAKTQTKIHYEFTDSIFTLLLLSSCTFKKVSQLTNYFQTLWDLRSSIFSAEMQINICVEVDRGSFETAPV